MVEKTKPAAFEKEVKPMKLTDKAKKRLTLAGLGVVCAVLVIAIASQFKTEAPKAVSVQPSSTASDAVSPGTPSAGPNNTQEVNAQPINPTVTPASSTDTGDSTGTEQSIQAEVTKSLEPPQEAKTDPSKTPDGEKVEKVTPTEHDKVTKPERNTSSSTPKAGDKNEKGQIWFPGFGWVDDEGANTGTKVGNEGDELTGNKVGSMD